MRLCGRLNTIRTNDVIGSGDEIEGSKATESPGVRKGLDAAEIPGSMQRRFNNEYFHAQLIDLLLAKILPEGRKSCAH
jgi:hypothetical protein